MMKKTQKKPKPSANARATCAVSMCGRRAAAFADESQGETPLCARCQRVLGYTMCMYLRTPGYPAGKARRSLIEFVIGVSLDDERAPTFWRFHRDLALGDVAEANRSGRSFDIVMKARIAKTLPPDRAPALTLADAYSNAELVRRQIDEAAHTLS